MRTIPALTLSLVAGLVAVWAGSLYSGVAGAQDVEADNSRQTFNAEVCTVDGLTSTQCDCAWNFVSRKLSAGDLKLAMLLLASSSSDAATAKKADQALDKSNASDKRRDSLASETSALVIEAEDACEK